FLHVQVFADIRHDGVGEYFQRQGISLQSDEAYPRRIRTDLGVCVKQLAHLHQQIADLVRRGVQADSERWVKPEQIPPVIVFDAQGGKLAVGNGDNGPVQGADPGRAHADVLDRAQGVAEAAEVAD